MRIVFAGGGTGGHLFPGLALAGALERTLQTVETVFVGTGRPVERRVLPRTGYGYHVIDGTGLADKGLWGKPVSLFRALRGIGRSVWLLRRLKPSLVIGLGGYSSGPMGVAARLMGIPLVIQEQNVRPGMTNRWLGRLAHRILCSYEESAAWFPRDRVRVVGNPVRESFLHGPDLREPGRIHLLVTGGSQGSRKINRVTPAALGLLERTGNPVSVLHQTGTDEETETARNYESAGVSAQTAPFVDDMAAAISRADLVVGRAGATILAELAAVGRGAVLIPYPYAAHNHQEMNARVWEVRKAARVILESELTPERLARELAELISSPEELRVMGERAGTLSRRDAAAQAVAVCAEVIRA